GQLDVARYAILAFPIVEFGHAQLGFHLVERLALAGELSYAFRQQAVVALHLVENPGRAGRTVAGDYHLRIEAPHHLDGRLDVGDREERPEVRIALHSDRCGGPEYPFLGQPDGGVRLAVHVPEIDELERALAHVEGHPVPVLDLRQDFAVAREGVAHARVIGHWLVTRGGVGLPHRFRRAGMGDDDRGR